MKENKIKGDLFGITDKAQFTAIMSLYNKVVRYGVTNYFLDGDNLILICNSDLDDANKRMIKNVVNLAAVGDVFDQQRNLNSDWEGNYIRAYFSCEIK